MWTSGRLLARRSPGQGLRQAPARHKGQLKSRYANTDLFCRRRHFARAFQAETGTTPGRYVERVRLEHARRLLEDTADPVARVARAWL